MSEEGWTEEGLVALDSSRVDVGQDVPFITDPADIVGEVSVVQNYHADVLQPDLLVVEYQASNCVFPVGGEVVLQDSGQVDVTIFTGVYKGVETCLAELVPYRATFYVEGAAEGAAVNTKSGGNVETGVVAPFLNELEELLLWPGMMPAYPA